MNQDRQQQEANQEKNEQNVQSMEQQQRDASSPSGRRRQQSSPSPVTQQDIDNKVPLPSHERSLTGILALCLSIEAFRAF